MRINMIFTVLKSNHLCNQDIVTCCLPGHVETSVHKHQFTTHKINFSLHFIWPLKDDSREISVLASCPLSCLIFGPFVFFLNENFHPFSCVENNRAEPTHKPKHDAFTGYGI